MNTTDEDILSASLIANIDEAVKMLLRHLHQTGRILVIVDSDLDGYASSSLLLNYLYSHFPTIVENKIYYRFHEGKIHGIDLAMVEQDVKLVVVPDAGSSDYEQHKILRE